MLRFSAGMAKPKNVLFNLRNLRNFFLKFAFQYPSTKYQQSISGNTPAYFWLFHATQALCVNNVAGIHSQGAYALLDNPEFTLKICTPLSTQHLTRVAFLWILYSQDTAPDTKNNSECYRKQYDFSSW